MNVIKLIHYRGENCRNGQILSAMKHQCILSHIILDIRTNYKADLRVCQYKEWSLMNKISVTSIVLLKGFKFEWVSVSLNHYLQVNKKFKPNMDFYFEIQYKVFYTNFSE